MTTKTRAEELAALLESGWSSDTSPDEMIQAAAELRRLAAVEAERDRLNRLLDEAVTRYDQMTDWFKSAQQKAANAMAERGRLAAEVEALRLMESQSRELADLLTTQRGELVREVDALRSLALAAYVGLGGECDLPVAWLDALNNAANGLPFTTDGLLPFESKQAAEVEALRADAERKRSAIEWALGTNGDFRARGDIGAYWWRAELAERCGIRWDGEQWVAIDASRGKG